MTTQSSSNLSSAFWDPSKVAPVTIGSSNAGASKVDSPAGGASTLAIEGTATKFHAELDAIVQRRGSDAECRSAINEILLRHRGLIGCVWHCIQGDKNADFDARLNGVILERSDVKTWISDSAMRAHREQRDCIATSVLVRNLVAISIPVFLHSGQTNPANESGWVLTLLVSDSGLNRALKEDLLAGQCAVRVWCSWRAFEGHRLADERLVSTSAMLELTSQLAGIEQTLTVAGQMIASGIQQHLQCGIVAFGTASRSGSSVKLAAVSGIGAFDGNSPQVRYLEAALSESVLRNRLTTFPKIDRGDEWQSIAHRRLVENIGAECAVSVPVRNGAGKVLGALVCCGAGKALLARQTLNIINSFSAPIGVAIENVIARESQFTFRLERYFKKIVTKSKVRSLGVVALVGATCLAAPMPYRVHCHGKVEPVMKRYCLAPYDGLIETSYVKPGDVVQSGEILAKMDGREIVWELAGINSETARALRERDSQMAEHQVAKAILAEHESQKLMTRSELLQYRRENLDIRSPLSGIVLGGSLEERQNEPVKMGQPLFEVAPIDMLRLEIGIPASEISNVSVGQEVSAKIDGVFQSQIQGRIARIRPQSEARNQQNVFVADLEFENVEHRFRPGMEGMVRVNAGTSPLIWNVGHRAWELIVTKLWW